MNAKSRAAAVIASPALRAAPVLDRMCSQFVLALTLKNSGRFNLRRDWSNLLALTGRHLVWPAPVLKRVRQFLVRRCKGNPQWSGHDALGDDAFVQRFGAWRGPYEEGTLFFYIDEYVKDSPKDLLTVLGATAEWLERSSEEGVDAGAEEHRRAGRPAAAQCRRARAAAVRHAGALST